MKARHAMFMLSAALLLLFEANPVPAGQEGRGTGRLAGYVVDEAGAPVPGAAIALEYLQFARRLTAVSNDKGRWGFIGLGAGAIRLTAEKAGFAPFSTELRISGVNRNPEPKITLTKGVAGGTAAGAAAAGAAAANEALAEGNRLFDAGDYAAALAVFRDFIAQNPAQLKVGVNAGNCLMELQRYDEAVTEYETVLAGLAAEPADRRDLKLEAQIRAGIGDAFLRQNEFAEAERHFKASLAIDPADHALAFNVAEIMMQAGRADEAIGYYEQAIRLKPEAPKAHLKLGLAWLNKGDIPKAVDAFNRCVAAAPADDPDAAAAKGILEKISKVG